MAISDYSTTRDDNAAITPGNIRSNDFARDQQIINAIRQLMADLASHVGTTAKFNIVQFNASTGALQSGDSGINFDQIWHDDALNTWYIVSDGASNREANNTTGILQVGHLRLTNGTDISSLSSTGHAFQIGPDTGVHLAIDTNEIQSRNNGAVTSLLLNDLGGNVIFHGNGSGIIDVQGGQIQFPATQIPSSGANVLDDYEEGTWTPVLTFGGATTGITYTDNLGSYVKVGQIVDVFFRIRLTSKGTATGSATITGLPFTASLALATGPYHTGLAAYCVNMASLNSLPSGYVNRNNTNITLTQLNQSNGTGTGRVNLNETNFTDTTDLLMSITYRAQA